MIEFVHFRQQLSCLVQSNAIHRHVVIPSFCCFSLDGCANEFAHLQQQLSSTAVACTAAPIPFNGVLFPSVSFLFYISSRLDGRSNEFAHLQQQPWTVVGVTSYASTALSASLLTQGWLSRQLP